jgi:HSP20 family protein
MANLQPWEPFSGTQNLHNQIDRMMGDMFAQNPAMHQHGNIGAADVYTEGDKQLVAEVQAPGFTKDDIEVNVHNGYLEIKGEKHDKDDAKKQKDRNYMLRESHASFYRQIALPARANADKVTADFDNGLLKVTVPFADKPKPKKVNINGTSNKKSK